METELYLAKKVGWFSVWKENGNWFSFTIEYDFAKWVVGVEVAHKFLAVNILFIRIHINWI